MVRMTSDGGWKTATASSGLNEISKTFETVFGKDSLNKRIRMVYASWSISEQEYFNNTLAWLEGQVGPVNTFLYAIAPTQYFGPGAQTHGTKNLPFNYSTATIKQVTDAFKAGGA